MKRPDADEIMSWLESIDAFTGELELCKHLETVVMSAPDAAAILTRRRAAFRAAAHARRSAAANVPPN